MASLKRSARKVPTKVEGKQDTSTDGVLELSVTVGYLAADVNREEILKLERLLRDYCEAGVVALERGDLEQHLHFQMVCRARVKSARAFGILVRKYMEWYGKKAMNPVGKAMCKVLTNHLIHTWKGMIGYCLKDSGLAHFETAMFNISDEEVVAGKTLHSIHGKADLKSRVVITNKNIGERAYVWYKYKENRQLTTTFLSTLTDMVNSAMFIPAAHWIIPSAGLGMDHRRMNSFWKCLTDPTNVDCADIADVFIRKREYVRGRYWDEDGPSPEKANAIDKYVYEASPPSVKEETLSTPPAVRVIPRSLDIPLLLHSASIRVKREIFAKNVVSDGKKRLFDDVMFTQRTPKSVSFSDEHMDFVPLNEIASLPLNVCLPTTDVLAGKQREKEINHDHFWDSVANKGLSDVSGIKRATSRVKVEDPDAECSNNDAEDIKVPVVILLSSDSEDEEPLVIKKRTMAAIFEDRSGSSEPPPLYNRIEDCVSFHVKVEPKTSP